METQFSNSLNDRQHREELAQVAPVIKSEPFSSFPIKSEVIQPVPVSSPFPIKSESMEESHPRYERPMEMAMMNHFGDKRVEPTSRLPTTSPVINPLDYAPYANSQPYDQRLVSTMNRSNIALQSYPQQRIDPEKVSKELKNYMLQTNVASPSMSSMEMEKSESGPEINGLAIKRSNGKLEIPDLLRTNGAVNNIDFNSLSAHQRAKREFVPEEKKDQGYWSKRVKNNDSARRSRVKRKALEKIMEGRLFELQQENIELRHEMNALKRRFGITDDMLPLTTRGGGKFSAQTPQLDCVDPRRSAASSPGGKFSTKDDDFEHQSSASDDSGSLDDARSHFMRSTSALSHSFAPSNRDRADSLGSNKSSGSVSVSGSAYPNSSPASNFDTDNVESTEDSGPLDLRNDLNSRLAQHSHSSTSAKAFTASSIRAAHKETDNFQCVDEKMDSHMKGVPLKCRWKLQAHCDKISADARGAFADA